MEGNSSKHLTLQRLALADVCKIDILIKISQNPQESTFNRFCICWSCRPLACSFVVKETPAQMFPVNLWNFQEQLSYRTLTGDYLWLFKYIKVVKSVPRYCTKDIEVLSSQAIFVTLCQLWKWSYMLRKLWKPTSRKTYQNLRSLQRKYLWRSFVIVKPFFCGPQ